MATFACIHSVGVGDQPIEKGQEDDDDDVTFGDDDNDNDDEEEEDEGGLSWRHIGLDDDNEGQELPLADGEGGVDGGGDDDSWWRCEPEPDQDDDTTVATADYQETVNNHNHNNHNPHGRSDKGEAEEEEGQDMTDLVKNRQSIDRMLDQKLASLTIADGLLLSPDRAKSKQLAGVSAGSQGLFSEGGPFSEGKDGGSGVSSPCSRSGPSPCTPIEMIESMHRTEKVTIVFIFSFFCTCTFTATLAYPTPYSGLPDPNLNLNPNLS